jgi:hypothetical protein
MADLQEILLRVLRELGPDASDADIGKKMGEYVEALPEADRAEVTEQMLKLTSSAQLARLRESPEARTREEVPGQIIEKPEGED